MEEPHVSFLQWSNCFFGINNTTEGTNGLSLLSKSNFLNEGLLQNVCMRITDEPMFKDHEDWD